MILKGNFVEILEQYQDEGDSSLIWMAVDNEEKDRVTITPINSELSFKPAYVVNSSWLKLV